MEILQLRNEVLVLRIKMKRNRIAMFQILLNTYRNMKSIQLAQKGGADTGNLFLIEQKIERTIQSINSNIESLSMLESELASLGGQ